MGRLYLRVRGLFFCLVATGIVSAIPAAPAAASPAIVTQNGPLKGIETPTTDEYPGIPYAVPPLGSLRWMPPQPHGRWHGVFQATQFGNFCTQPNGFGGTLGGEDCLTLNIYTPRARKNQNKHHGLPVMVWIHGGALVTGAGRDYDPTRIVEQGGVIVVTINLSAGPFGFLRASGDRCGRPSQRQLDQQLALKCAMGCIWAGIRERDRILLLPAHQLPDPSSGSTR
jgi:para-nitrobenzyl esterase